MHHLKKFKIFEFNNFVPERYVKNQYVLSLAKKMGEIDNYGMEVLQGTLNRMSTTSYSHIIPRMNHKKVSPEDINVYVNTYVNNSPIVKGPKIIDSDSSSSIEPDSSRFNVYKNIKNDFHKKVADRISTLDGYGMFDLQNVLDRLLRKGIHRPDIAAYVNEYVKHKFSTKTIEFWKGETTPRNNSQTLGPKELRAIEAKEKGSKKKQEISEKDYLDLIDYHSSVG